jgi:hypothetical protein
MIKGMMIPVICHGCNLRLYSAAFNLVRSDVYTIENYFHGTPLYGSQELVRTVLDYL